MKRIELVALKKQTYAGRPVDPGDAIFASRQDARVLIAIKRAKVAPEVAAVEVPEVAPAPVVQEVVQPKPEPKASIAPKPKRTYQRKDMTAETPKRAYKRKSAG